MTDLSRQSTPHSSEIASSDNRRAAAATTPDRAVSHDAEPFLVGSGDFVAIVDQIETISAPPVQTVDPALRGYRFTATVTKLRDRAARNQTGKPLAVRLDRQLFLAANTERRRAVENDIRAMHGLALHDGRTLQVEEVLGRYDDRLGGTDEQLIELRRWLDGGGQIRLLATPARVSEETYRQLGALKHKYGDRLSIMADGEPDQRNALDERVVSETFRARIESVREQLLAGVPSTLAIDSATLARRYRSPILALRRQFGAQLRITVDDAAGQSDAILAALRDAGQIGEQPQIARSGETVTFEPAGDSPARAGRSDWAREVAARVRKPWWQRTRLYRKLTGGSDKWR